MADPRAVDVPDLRPTDLCEPRASVASSMSDLWLVTDALATDRTSNDGMFGIIDIEPKAKEDMLCG